MTRSVFYVFILFVINSVCVAQSVHFFGSIKSSQTTIDENQTPFDSINNKPTLSNLSTAGVSVSANVNERIQTLAQFTYLNNKYIGLDLLQLRHNIDENFLIRLGKQRIPAYFHSENIQLQALLPWMGAPREVYVRTPIYSFTGISAERKIGKNLNFHFYGGDTKDEFLGSVDYNVTTENLVGLRMNVIGDSFDFFINYFIAEGNVKVESPLIIAAPGVTADAVQNFKMESIRGGAAGIKYSLGEYFLLSEYSLLTSQSSAYERAEGAYVSLGGEIFEKWIPVFTFSTDLDVVSVLAPSKTTTYSFNVNYNLDLNNVLKFGIDHVNYKKQTVMTEFGPTSLGVSGSPDQNFEIYSLMWAFVY